MTLAPVILFVYSRPDHTRKTLNALRANALSKDTELFIFADGPKQTATRSEVAKVEATRAVIREQQWCAKINIIERSKNLGLAANIIEGVTSVVNKYGTVIVLEDDIVTGPGFLTYMNESLELYKNDERVMHISGYTFPWIDPAKVGGDTFFYRVPSCWGWATWDRAWKHYDDDSRRLFLNLCEKKLMSFFDFGYSGVFLGQLNANLVKVMRTWAVKWYASTVLQNGLALHPASSLVNNIGFDNTGENSASTHVFDSRALEHSQVVSRNKILESKYVQKTMYRRYANPMSTRIKIFLANRIKNFVQLKYFSKTR